MNLSEVKPTNLPSAKPSAATRKSYRDYVGRDQVTARDPGAANMAKNGRYGDTMMAHVTPGEIVVPLPVQTPRVVSTIKNEMDRAGVPLSRYVVGSDQNSINPSTGVQEHGFLSKVLGVAVPAIGGFLTGGPAGAALGALKGVGGLAGGGSGGQAAGGGTGGGGVTSSSDLAALPTPNAAAIAAERSTTKPFEVPVSGRSPIPDEQGLTDMGASSTPDDLSAPNAGGGGIFDLTQAAEFLQQILNQGGGGTPEFYDMNAPRAYSQNSMNPRTGKQEFYTDEEYYGPGRVQREVDIRNLGYTGAFGRGLADSWLNSKYGSTDIATINAKRTGTQAPSSPAPASPAPAAPSSPTPAANAPAPSATSTPTPSTTSSGPTKAGNDGYYDLYKPAGGEIRVVSIAPGKTSIANARSNLGGIATGDDLVTLSDGRTVLASTLKGPNGDYRISTGQIINPETNSVIGAAAPRNDMQGFDYYYPGSSPYVAKPAAPTAAAPAAPAATPASPAPSSPLSTATVTPYYEPKYLNELIGRELGYQGPWGAGGMAAWEAANPAKSAQLQALLAQRGGQRLLSDRDIQQYGEAAGLTPPKPLETPSWLKEIQDRLAALQQAAAQTTTGTSTTTGTGTGTTTNTISQPEEPSITRVSPINPDRSRRFGSRRYRGSLARNF